MSLNRDFWGVILTANRKYKCENRVHLRNVALDLSKVDKDTILRSRLQVSDGTSQYILCHLDTRDCVQYSLDHVLVPGTTLSGTGPLSLHVTGYTQSDTQPTHQVEQQSQQKKRRVDNDGDCGSNRGNQNDSLLDMEAEVVSDVEETEEEEEEEEASDDSDVEVSINHKLRDKTQSSQKRQSLAVSKEVVNKEASKPKQKFVLPGGVSVEEIFIGNGAEAVKGSQVTVYYVGRLAKNNKQFDATTSGPGFSFRLGAGEVIKGWDRAVEGMKTGGKRRVTCPPNMAYGKAGSPPVIPPNSHLVFEITLKKVV